MKKGRAGGESMQAERPQRLFGLTDELRRQLEESGDAPLAAVVKKVIEKAKGGDLGAARFIWERLEGPAKGVGDGEHAERWRHLGA